MFIEYFKKLSKDYAFEKIKLKQNNNLLNPNIRATGCYFRSLIGIAETKFQRYLTSKQINELYDFCIQNPEIMLPNCYMNEKLTKVVELAALKFSHSIKCYQLGIYQGNEFIFWNNYNKNYTDTIIQWKTEMGTHFTQADKNMNEIFDPWQGKIKKLYKTKIILYKVV